jgi:hypothetical protein
VAFAKDRATLIDTVRALDRVLLANHFVIPTYTCAIPALAYWNRISHPEELPYYSLGFPGVWWFKATNRSYRNRKALRGGRTFDSELANRESPSGPRVSAGPKRTAVDDNRPRHGRCDPDGLP